MRATGRWRRQPRWLLYVGLVAGLSSTRPGAAAAQPQPEPPAIQRPAEMTTSTQAGEEAPTPSEQTGPAPVRDPASGEPPSADPPAQDSTNPPPSSGTESAAGDPSDNPLDILNAVVPTLTSGDESENPSTPPQPTTAVPDSSPTRSENPPKSNPDAQETPQKPKKRRLVRPYPRLMLAVGPIIGPHAFGNEECREEEARCETNGSFFGAGLGAELRAQLYSILYAHVRGFVVGNVSPNEPVYRGAGGFGLGLGVYAQHVFARAEYIALGAFGDNTFEPPFSTEAVGRDEWGHHAGMVSAGFRRQIRGRYGIELWGGPMFGPRSVRTISNMETERRTLITFLVGVNLSIDFLPPQTQPENSKAK